MKHTMRIITLLLLTMAGAGQTWAEDDEEYQFGHITYNGTAANDGGTLTFYTNSKDAGQGTNPVAPNGTGPTALTDIMVKNGEDLVSVGTGFFIMATPAVGHRLPAPAADGTVSFIQAEVVTSAQQAPSRRNAPDPTLEVGQTLPVKFHGYYYGLDGDPATDYYGLYYVVMPADVNLSVSITATFPGVTTTTVNYIDPTKTGDAQNCSVTAYVLDGTEARLGYGSYNDRTQETWYVLPDDLTYTNGLELYGKVHLILADGKTMSYDGTERFFSGYGTLDIYGQGGETEGTINAKSTEENCINVTGYLTINGGNISAESTNTSNVSHYGIKGETLITINGGTVNGKSNVTGIGGCNIYINGGIVNGTGTHEGISTASGTMLTITGGHVCGIGDKFGMRGMKGLIITGGQIEATSGTGDDEFGIYSDHGDIILGWTNADDYIKANSYHCGTAGKAVKTADGKVLQFTDGDNTMKLIGDITDLDAIKNQKLTPYGIWGYCGTDDTKTTDVDESKTLTWDIALKDEPTSATDLATMLTIEGCGTMASYTTEAPAPWSDKTIEAANILASADVANVNAIAENIPVTLGYTGPVATTHTFNGYFVRKTADNTNISANVLSHNDQTNAWTLTMPDYAVNVSPKLTRNTTVSVEIVAPVTTIDGHPLIIVGDVAHIKVTLNPVAGEGENNLPKINGYVTISVDNGTYNPKSYNVAIVNGVGHYYVSNLAQDAYAITASFAGDDNHAASTTENATTLEVCMILTETTCSVDKTPVDGGDMPMMNVGEAMTISAYVNEVGLQRPVIDSETGKKKAYLYPEADVKPLSIDEIITVILDGAAYTVGGTEGKGTLTLKNLLVHKDLPPNGLADGIWLEPRDHYVFYATFAGNDRFLQSNSEYKRLKVNRIPITVNAGVTSPVIAK